MEPIAKSREKRRTACLDLQQWHTTGIADILKPTTPWAFRAKLPGQAQGSAQDVEPIPLYEAADNPIRCVEDQRRRGLADTYSNLKIAIVDAVKGLQKFHDKGEKVTKNHSRNWTGYSCRSSTRKWQK